MKTVGEILKTSRREKSWSLEYLEERTKIRKKFLEALEANEWQKLPSLTYMRGFIKNYAEFLGLDSKIVLAIFRRQFNTAEKQKVIPQGLSEPLNEPFFRFTPSKIMTGFVLLLLFLFFFWLFWQYQSFDWAPKIMVETPQENEIIRGDKVRVVGKTDPNAILTINGQKIELLDGKFSEELTISPGTVLIDIVAINKFGKKQELKRIIKVETP